MDYYKYLRNSELVWGIYELYLSANLTLTSRFPFGRDVFDHDWDVLVLLDTCRPDALKEVSPEYDFLSDIDSVWSIGGSSLEWMSHTFDRRNLEDIRHTGYVSGNAWAGRIIIDRTLPEHQLNATYARTGWDIAGEEDFALLDRAWEYEATGVHGPSDGYPPPRHITDRAIDLCRGDPPKRLILHYNQPHSPFLAQSFIEEREAYDYEKAPFKYIQSGGNPERVWSAYLNELRFVLDDIELLIENLDSDSIVISADHGEAFGEFGIYGHRTGSIHPSIRQVPWVETSGTDENTYSPDPSYLDKRKNSIDDTLSALGYL